MTTTSKSTCELYRIWTAGHYAAISLDAWSISDQSYGGEILVHSSVGNFGGEFPASAVPFKQHLLNLSQFEFFDRCGGSFRPDFDGNGSVAKLSKEILELRRARRLTSEQACELWTDLQFSRESATGSARSFLDTATRLRGQAPVLGEPSTYVLHAYALPAQFFWETLWPEFRAVLRRQSPELHALAA